MSTKNFSLPEGDSVKFHAWYLASSVRGGALVNVATAARLMDVTTAYVLKLVRNGELEVFSFVFSDGFALRFIGMHDINRIVAAKYHRLQHGD